MTTNDQQATVNATTNVEVLRKDYTPADFRITDVRLYCDVHDNEAVITATLTVVRQGAAHAALLLDGESMELRSLHIDGVAVAAERYQTDDTTLRITDVPDSFVLETVVAIQPQNNTSLNGLYQSSGMYCTQCEAMGFRKITYFLDRPDNMARFVCTVEAEQARFPVLLSNGNRIDSGVCERAGDTGAVRHFATWEDPIPKPCYLFALVAGNLRCHSGTFTRMGGRDVALEIWVEEQNRDKCEHALVSLQKSMKWDEEVYGREYDLDIYMIVAVNDFNMGAMENKGLNIFNSKFVLALPETATDTDYEGVEAVIAHEYFHNWTGNRVTCRDWFQLTLKEGLTVFRDQSFTADMTSESVKRIDDVRQLRLAQFPEDRGPMSHPIRPDSYISMDNFYTMTVYEKGAEVIRMYHSILGAEGFRAGTDLYFERHDGSAVTCDDFRAAMADANAYDFTQFGAWYSQRGTPHIDIEEAYDAAAQTYTLTMTQSIPALNADEDHFLPLHIPVAIGLLDATGADMVLWVDGKKCTTTTYAWQLQQTTASIVFEQVGEQPTPSILRNFSAPVTLSIAQDDERLAFLMAHDSDSFNRWQAGQSLAGGILQACIRAEQDGADVQIPAVFIQAYGVILRDTTLDGAIASLMLNIPEERELALAMECIDVDAIHAARTFMCQCLVAEYHDEIIQLYGTLTCSPQQSFSADQSQVQRRRQQHALLRLLAAADAPEVRELAGALYAHADNMTDSMAALAALNTIGAAEEALADFYTRWHHDPLVLDKWFTLQASSSHHSCLETVQSLATHPDFTLSNPNRVRSLIGAFAAGNQRHFHAPHGAGYTFLADHVIALHDKNPQVAARLVSAFNHWKRYDSPRQQLMIAALRRIAATESLSKDVYEIVNRALADA